jgi:(4S)-4-hydroxy-5-phosphonooxypentane-2,3-dione isomerase
MHIVHVHIQVKQEFIEVFKEATVTNAVSSSKEPGIISFTVLQQDDDPSKFLLLEVYKTQEDQARHKETAHYNTWRNVAEPWMKEPRSRSIYNQVFPKDLEY